MTDVDRLKGTDVNGQNETDIDVVKDNCRWTDREGPRQLDRVDKATDADRLTYRDAETEMDIHGSRQTERDTDRYIQTETMQRDQQISIAGQTD